MNHSSHQLTRRDALAFLGAAATTFPRRASAANASRFPKGAIIRTILKDVPPEALAGGATLFHEHLSLEPGFMPKWRQFAPAEARRGAAAPPATAAVPQQWFMENLDLMTAEMQAAASGGVGCIVDAGQPDMGRNLDFLKQLSIKSGMPIVASCGYYAQPFYPPEIASMSEDQIARDLIRQAATEPVGALGEIGTWDEMTADERKVFRAVCKTHLATNLPIFTHTNFGKGALAQLDLFESMGVKPGRVAIGHVGGLIDPKAEVQKALCKRGAFVGFDRQGGPGDAPQVTMVMALIEAGYADRVLLASDFSSAAQLKTTGGPGYAKTVTVFAPKLRAAGAAEETVRRILVDNPRRFLAFVPKQRRKI